MLQGFVMAKILSFRKLDYSAEAEEITGKVIKKAFYPVKAVVCVLLLSFIIFFALGYGSISTFVGSVIFKYLQLALFVTSLWLIINLKFGLKCPNCNSSFFQFSKKLQIKPRACPNCGVIFVKKTI